MKTYGVNWFLVWMSLVILFCPIYLWAENVLLLPWPQVAPSPAFTWVQALGQSICWTWVSYYLYGKTLADPKAVERARQSLQRSAAARYRHYRWLIMWATMFAVVSLASTVCRLIFDHPSWLYVAGYSLVVPCGCLVFIWLLEKAMEKGQLAQLLEGGEESATG